MPNHLLLALLWAAWLPIAGQTAVARPGSASARPAPSLPARYADLADQQLDRHRLLEAALLAGGMSDPERLAGYRTRIEILCRESAIDRPRGADTVLAADLFRRMHHQLLTGPYQEDAFRLDQTVDGGGYNCVTSTILFVCLCRERHIPITAVAVSGHVYCRLIGAVPEDIQTTCPDWFEQSPQSRHTQPSSGALAAGSPRILSDVQLLAKVLYNRAVALLAENQFAAAVEQLEWACRLDPADDLARRNRVAALNNWALSLTDQRRFAEAADRIADGLALAPADPALLANDLHVHQRWALQLCAQGDYAAAVELLERGHIRRPDADLFDRGRWSVYRHWILSRTGDGHPEEVAAILADVRRRYPEASQFVARLAELAAPDHAD